MGLRHHGFSIASALAVAVAAGCSGGGSGPGPAATPATPTPTVRTRPLAAGDTFAYAGTSTNADTFDGSNPPGGSTVTSQVAQAIAVSGPVAYNGLATAFDFKTSETDAAPLQQTSITTDTYYGTKAGAGGTTQLVTSGFVSSDSFGEHLTVTLGSGNGLVDILPESAGTSWSNDGAQTILRTEADGTSETRTYAGDGSYADTTVYPQGSQFTPQPAPLTARIVEAKDGSGSYSLPLGGTSPNATISFGTPDPTGHVPIVVSAPNPVETATPAAFYSPGPLYRESDVTSVGRAIPAACKAGSSFGTSANAVTQTATRVDTILGTVESLAQTSYVVPKYGVACVQLTDTTDVYYDYSGQSNKGLAGIAFDGGPTPVEVNTLATTLGLTNAVVQAMSVRAGTTAAATAGWRLANARSNFIATVERARAARTRRAVAYVSEALRRLPAAAPGGKK